MKTFVCIVVVFFSLVCATGTVTAQNESINAIRMEVQKLCAVDEAVPAFHLAMKALRQSEMQYGRDHLQTAQCMVTVADVVKLRQKYHLARALYGRALPTLEQGLSSSHPDVVRCKLELSNLASLEK